MPLGHLTLSLFQLRKEEFVSPLFLTTASLGAGWVSGNSSFQRLGVLPAGDAAQGEVEALQDPSEDGVREQVCEEMGGCNSLFPPGPH